MTKQHANGEQEAHGSSIRIAISVAVALALSLSAPTALAASSLQLQSLKTHSRLSIQLDPSVETDWKETADGFSLTLRGVALQDLYLGGSEIASIRDARLSSISVEEVGSDVVVHGKWNFAGGETALANPKMERFTYREKDPARFVMDFWPKAGVTKVEAERKKKENARQASINRAETDAKRRRDRRIAAEKASAIESDVSRFCKEPLQEEIDVFLEMVPFHEAPALAEFIPTGMPDDRYPFLEPKAGTPEEETVKLAFSLYAKRDFALTVRTLDFFLKDHPKSMHRTDLEFLRANALLRLGMDGAGNAAMKEQAERAFEEVREKNPGTPASLASALYLAEQKRAAENDLQTIERYHWIATRYPNHRNVWAWRMLAAEALYRIKQTDRAVQEYEWVEANAPTSEAKASAAVRIGDAYLHRAQYDRALAAYFRASQNYPKESAKSPSLQVNRGESLYWLGQHDRAQAQFEKFGQEFPGHPAGWRALLRLAEIEGRKSGEAAAQASRGRFLEVVNRYPFSPGAVVARMRLVPCGDHGGFDAKTAAEFFERETRGFDGGGQIRLDRFAEFRSMIRIRSMVLLDDQVAALEAAVVEKETLSKKSAAYSWVKSMERKLFRKRVLELLDAGQRFEAVQFFDRFASRIDLSEDLPEDATPERVAMADPDYLLRLSRVASEIGFGRTASKISERYSAEAKRLGISGGADRAVASNGAPKDLETRLRESERLFTEAKALWMAGSSAERKKNTESVRSKLERMSDESPFSYQKEIILGLMAEQDKKWATALSHASKASMLLAKMTNEDSIERIGVDQWSARLQEAGGNARSAVETYRRLQRSNAGVPGTAAPRAKAEGVGLAPIEGIEAWTLREADLSGKLEKWGEAADAYGRAVNLGLGGNRAIYQYALSLEKIGGDEEKIATLLRKAAESDRNDFWKELARKKLAGSDAKEGKAI
jgi:tetratricopeptide (TPR) repeat protein